MKKILSLIALVISLNSFGQDSVKLTFSLQSRDVEYIASVSSMDNDEGFFDSVKYKYRVQNEPTGNTLVSITLYTIDVIHGFTKLKNDPTALKANCTSRVETILRALNNVYLTGKLDQLDADDSATFSTMRGVGRFKLKKKN